MTVTQIKGCGRIFQLMSNKDCPISTLILGTRKLSVQKYFKGHKTGQNWLRPEKLTQNSTFSIVWSHW